MFRITRADHTSHILITIEGQLARDYVGIAESACGEALSTNIPVTVFLNRVMGIDAHGRAFLKQLLMKRARLRARGVYLRHLVGSLRKDREIPGQAPQFSRGGTRKPQEFLTELRCLSPHFAGRTTDGRPPTCKSRKRKSLVLNNPTFASMLGFMTCSALRNDDPDEFGICRWQMPKIGTAQYGCGMVGDVSVSKSVIYEALFELAQSISGHSDLDSLCKALYRSLKRVIKLDGIGLLLYDAPGNVLRMHALFSTESIDKGEPFQLSPTDDNPAGRVWTNLKPVVIPQLDQETRWPEFLKRVQAARRGSSLLLVPMTTGD